MPPHGTGISLLLRQGGAEKMVDRYTGVATVLASVGTAMAGLARQDWVVISGALTTLGLASLSLYQKFREEKRKQDAADLALYATSQKAKIEALDFEVSALKEQLCITQSEAQRWLRLYQEITTKETKE